MAEHDRFGALNRRETLAAGFAIGAAPALLAAKSVDPRRDERLWYRQPAGAWTEALPVGNGRQWSDGCDGVRARGAGTDPA